MSSAGKINLPERPFFFLIFAVVFVFLSTRIFSAWWRNWRTWRFNTRLLLLLLLCERYFKLNWRAFDDRINLLSRFWNILGRLFRRFWRLRLFHRLSLFLFALFINRCLFTRFRREIEFGGISWTLWAEVRNVFAFDALVIVVDSDTLEMEPEKYKMWKLFLVFRRRHEFNHKNNKLHEL